MVELADLERVREAEYRRGYDDARQELIARVEKDLQALRDLLGSVGGQLAALRQRMEEDGFRLAIAVAERIVRREVALDDAAVIGQVKEAIGRLVGVEAITLRVNPADEELVRSQRQELQARADGVQEMVIEGDEKVERGGCIIESIAGNVDARRATVIAQIEAALFGQPGGGI
jgi:flagellar assembly protein FliH